MLFNSLAFLLFFPVVTLIYFLLPHRARYIWLLCASYFFYMQWNASYALLIFTSTLITYLAGLVIQKANARGRVGVKKAAVAVSFTVNIAILVFFKYFDFLLANVNALLSVFGAAALGWHFDVLLPVGISFYTFQALGYTVDVYRGDVAHEKNFLKYALFVSFFPQLVAGPIERSGNLLCQFSERHRFDGRRAVRGLTLMLWGYFEKLVIADRAAILVNTVYNDPANPAYGGFAVIIATVLFAFQIYCDFASYSDIARGAAEVMGFRLMRNFDTPYFSKSVAEFWRRWHISLSTWFRDYLYIPLGGNRKGKARKYLNLMIVFFISGLWHGASWHFVVWGVLNGAAQVIGAVTLPVRKKVSAFLGNRENFSGKLAKTLFTFAFINVTWVFFRAGRLTDAVLLIKKAVFGLDPWMFTDGTLFSLGLDGADMFILLTALAVLLVAGLLRYRGIGLRDALEKQGLWFRYAVLLGGIFAVLIFGIYGVGYDAASFIYFQF